MVSNFKLRQGLIITLNAKRFVTDTISFQKKTKDSILLTYFINNGANLIDRTSYEITLSIHSEFLHSYSLPVQELSIRQFPIYQEILICNKTKLILHEIITCKLAGVYQNMFLESKAIELFLCLQNANSSIATSCETCKFLQNSIEKNKIHRAKSIILNSLLKPPTISELSIEIGMNQCYLKKGFKEVYGTTIYEFVQEQRMLKATELLRTQKYPISKVAEEIGFASQSSFSSAFKKHTGIFPSELVQE